MLAIESQIWGTTTTREDHRSVFKRMGHEPVCIVGDLIHHLCSPELATWRKLLHSPADSPDSARVALCRQWMEQESSGLREEDLEHRLSHGIVFNARHRPVWVEVQDHVPPLTILGQQYRVQDQSLVVQMAMTDTVNCSCPSISDRISIRLWHAHIPKPKPAMWMSCCRQLVCQIDALLYLLIY
jgi:hypothetical protein